jgi:hypothetical protein
VAEGFSVDPSEIVWVAVQCSSNFGGRDGFSESFTECGLGDGREFLTVLGRLALRIFNLGRDLQEHQFHQHAGVVRLKARVLLIIEKPAQQLYQTERLRHSGYLRDRDMIGRGLFCFEMEV